MAVSLANGSEQVAELRVHQQCIQGKAWDAAAGSAATTRWALPGMDPPTPHPWASLLACQRSVLCADCQKPTKNQLLHELDRSFSSAAAPVMASIE